MNKKAAVILSGCGYLDGAEIREAVLSLLYLSQAGIEASIFAPNAPQHHTINHLTGEATAHNRNMMEEAARIARGEVTDIKQLTADAYDALVVPGGFGVAKNLSNFAFEGSQASILPEVENIVTAFHAQKKPILAICIAPAIVARILGKHRPKLTIGHDAATAAILEAFGAEHHPCNADDMVEDAQNHLITTPAYMLDAPLSSMGRGIEKAVQALSRQMQKQAKAA